MHLWQHIRRWRHWRRQTRSCLITSCDGTWNSVGRRWAVLWRAPWTHNGCTMLGGDARATRSPAEGISMAWLWSKPGRTRRTSSWCTAWIHEQCPTSRRTCSHTAGRWLSWRWPWTAIPPEQCEKSVFGRRCTTPADVSKRSQDLLASTFSDCKQRLSGQHSWYARRHCVRAHVQFNSAHVNGCGHLADMPLARAIVGREQRTRGTMNTVERCTGVIKRRWHCLHNGQRVAAAKACMSGAAQQSYSLTPDTAWRPTAVSQTVMEKLSLLKMPERPLLIHWASRGGGGVSEWVSSFLTAHQHNAWQRWHIALLLIQADTRQAKNSRRVYHVLSIKCRRESLVLRCETNSKRVDSLQHVSTIRLHSAIHVARDCSFCYVQHAWIQSVHLNNTSNCAQKPPTTDPDVSYHPRIFGWPWRKRFRTRLSKVACFICDRLSGDMPRCLGCSEPTWNTRPFINFWGQQLPVI